MGSHTSLAMCHLGLGSFRTEQVIPARFTTQISCACVAWAAKLSRMSCFQEAGAGKVGFSTQPNGEDSQPDAILCWNRQVSKPALHPG